jgi:hypothetical protein
MKRLPPIFALAVIAVVGCGPSGGATSTPAASPSASPAYVATSSPEAGLESSASPAPMALPQGSDVIDLDPALFEGVPLDHPFWPMSVGSHWVYAETHGEGNEQQVEVTVLDETKDILGIQATVVHDIVTLDGKAIEDTLDWYAQDLSGNLWYLGEDTKEYQEGVVVSTKGSWVAGVDGAQAGIILPANPEVGMNYRQEYYAGRAEDAAEVLGLDERVEVPAGMFEGCLKTRDFTPLDPGVEEEKYYARGVGPVQVIQTKGGASTERLIEHTPGD